MPLFVEKNMRYAHFAEICKKMGQYAKYVAIAYSHKTDMPNQIRYAHIIGLLVMILGQLSTEHTYGMRRPCLIARHFPSNVRLSSSQSGNFSFKRLVN